MKSHSRSGIYHAKQHPVSTALYGDSDLLRELYGEETLVRLYSALLLPRLVEERMLLMLRQGKLSKWFSGIGQEAISVGATLALDPDEFILPLHRNLGVFLNRKVPLWRVLCQIRGTASGFTQGRDRSFHFGTLEHHIIGMISHLGPQMGVALGTALSHLLEKERKVTLVFSGEGGTSEGDFHEALNVAAVWNLPVIFLIENNGYALSTPTAEQYSCERLSERAIGYGIEGVTIEGNDVLEVFSTVSRYAQEIRENPRPVLIEALTFRMRGHEEASGVKYVPEELMSTWSERDPIRVFEEFLRHSAILDAPQIAEIRRGVQEYVESELERAEQDSPVQSSEEKELGEVFVPFALGEMNPPTSHTAMRFVDAITDGLRRSLYRHARCILLGQDIGKYGGVFKVTQGFLEEFGEERIRSTPLCESAILGSAVGLSATGYKSVIEMQFSDFVSSGYTQVINNIAKLHYRWGHAVDTVIRMPCGGGVGAGPFHSQTAEAWFVHAGGLKIAYPAFPSDAKGLLMTAIEDGNPVMFFEHKALYRSSRGEVPEGEYFIPFGEAKRVVDGEDIAIITYGMGVHWALRLVDQYPEISILVLDLRTLIPLDFDAVCDAVRKTGRVLVLHEASLACGFGAELAAKIQEHMFSQLDAPILRCAGLDTPVPFAPALEAQYAASARLASVFERLVEY